MRSAIRTVTTLLVTIALALGALAGEREVRRDTERRDSERDRPKTQESLRDRLRSADSLPAEFKSSPLYLHEVNDPRTSEERGRTLRDHVPDRSTAESIRSLMVAREQTLRQLLEAGKLREHAYPDQLTVYVSRREAETLTQKTLDLPENVRRREAWLADATDKADLTLQGAADHAVGVGIARVRGEGRFDLGQPFWATRQYEVQLRKDGRGGSFVYRSSPTLGEGAKAPPGSREHLYERIRTDSGPRPDPRTYIPPREYAEHLSKFSEGASYFVLRETVDRYGRDHVGRDAQFVIPREQADSLLAKAKGDVAVLERELGIPEGQWRGKELLRIDIDRPADLHLRMATGNEMGTNDLWIPGGKTPAGYDEAVVDRIPRGKYRESAVWTKDR